MDRGRALTAFQVDRATPGQKREGCGRGKVRPGDSSVVSVVGSGPEAAAHSGNRTCTAGSFARAQTLAYISYARDTSPWMPAMQLLMLDYSHVTDPQF